MDRWLSFLRLLHHICSELNIIISNLLGSLENTKIRRQIVNESFKHLTYYTFRLLSIIYDC